MTTILTFTFSMSTKEYTLPDLFIKLTMFYFRRRVFSLWFEVFLIKLLHNHHHLDSFLP